MPCNANVTCASGLCAGNRQARFLPAPIVFTLLKDNEEARDKNRNPSKVTRKVHQGHKPQVHKAINTKANKANTPTYKGTLRRIPSAGRRPTKALLDRQATDEGAASAWGTAQLRASLACISSINIHATQKCHWRIFSNSAHCSDRLLMQRTQLYQCTPLFSSLSRIRVP